MFETGKLHKLRNKLANSRNWQERFAPHTIMKFGITFLRKKRKPMGKKRKPMS